MTNRFPSTTFEREVVDVWRDLLGNRSVELDDDFFALGADSLLALRMIEALRQRLGLTLPLDALVAGATARQIAAGLARIALVLSDSSNTGVEGTTEEGALITLRAGEGGVPLIFIHPAGGSALCYLNLARRLSPLRPIYAIHEPPAMADRELSIEARASRYLELIETRLHDRERHLAGYSFGGLIAFEIARQQAAAGRSPGLVALLDTAPPMVDGRREDDPFVGRLTEILDAAALDADAENPERERAMWEALADLTFEFAAPRETRTGSQRRFGGAERVCRSFGFVPASAIMSYAEICRFLRSMRTALRAARRYAPASYAGRVLLIQAIDPTAGADARKRSERQVQRWASLAPVRLDARFVAANHLTLLGEDSVAAVANALDESTAESARPRPFPGRYSG